MSKALGKLMTVMPTALAVKITMGLVSKPRSVKVDEAQAKALESATQIHWGNHNKKAAYQWGDGPEVILVFHGWGGRAAQLAQLAKKLSEQNLTVIAIDFTAHGNSSGTNISFSQMIADITEAYEKFGGDCSMVVAHSAGALSMMAARYISSLHFKKIVCINAPISPYPPITALKRVLEPPRRVVDACEKIILEQFQGLLSAQYDAACYKERPDEKLLIINDTSDKITDHQDGLLILKQWPSAHRVVTNNLGHQGPLTDININNKICEFALLK